MRAFLAVTLLTILFCRAAYIAGFRVNHSQSMPLGLWRQTAGARGFKTGDVVVVCPPLTDRQGVYLDPGYCPSRKEPMLKHVAAVAGDDVLVARDGITVNGRRVKQTAPFPVDGAGRALEAYPVGRYTVPADQVWLLAPLPRSFDSRYIGPVSTSDIKGLASPVLVW